MLDYSKLAIRNINRLDADRFDCEINHPELGWIPFTATKDDPEVSARVIYQRIQKSKEKK